MKQKIVIRTDLSVAMRSLITSNWPGRAVRKGLLVVFPLETPREPDSAGYMSIVLSFSVYFCLNVVYWLLEVGSA